MNDEYKSGPLDVANFDRATTDDGQTIDMKAFARVGRSLQSAQLGQFSAGDKAIVRTGNAKYDYALHLVRSVGAKSGQVTLDNGERFLADGSQIGGSRYHYKVLLRASPELEERAIRQQRVAFLEGVIDWDSSASDECLADLMRVLRRHEWDGVPE